MLAQLPKHCPQAPAECGWQDRHVSFIGKDMRGQLQARIVAFLKSMGQCLQIGDKLIPWRDQG